MEERIRTGKRAEAILADPLIAEVLEEIRSKQFLAIERTKPDENVSREHHYAMLRAIDEFKSALNARRDDGIIEQARIDKNRKG